MFDYYDYSYSDSPFGTIIMLLFAAASIVSMWKIFEKAGEPGWAAIIPIYNLYVLFKITWGSGLKFLLMLIPIANVVFAIMTYVKLAKVFGKSGAFALGLIFLGPIFCLILAFDDSYYLGVPGAAGAYAQQGYQPQQGYQSQQNYQSQQSAQSASNQGAAYCPSCGQPVTGGTAFCQNCGTKIS